MTYNRVAITGAGAICGLGCSVKEIWENALLGRSGISTLEHFNTQDLPVTFGGEIKDFVLSDDILPLKEQSRYDRFVHYSLHSGFEALKQANLLEHNYDPYRFGCIIGCGMGGLPSIEHNMQKLFDKGPRRVSPFAIPGAIPNMPSGMLSLRFNLRGANYSVSSACASSAHAIGLGMMEIQLGRLDAVMVGGVEGILSRFPVAGFSSMKALSKRNHEPQKASRPFDQQRDGFVMGDGAGIIILENWDQAKARGAHILAELVGFGSSADAHHITAPHPKGDGAIRSMHMAIEQANINASEIGHINAHGTSTPLGDIVETLAIKQVFNSHAKKIKISSTKSMTGHLLGAAAGLESIFCLQSLLTQKLPPTINLENPDPECDLDYTAAHSSTWQGTYALNNSFGFGGTNASLIFKKYN